MRQQFSWGGMLAMSTTEERSSGMRRFRPRLTYANVTATLALFIALGGSGYAALKLPKNSVGPRQLKRHAVTTSKLGSGAVTGSRVRGNSLTGGQINESSLGKVPSAGSADSAATLGGVSAAQLKVRCPGGTVLYAGACFETAQREPAGIAWLEASRECAGAGRRLPDPSELAAFGRQAGVDFPGFEWTSATYDDTHMMTVDKLGNTALVQGATAHPFRCVAGLAN
jgi:hypothetical protein